MTNEERVAHYRALREKALRLAHDIDAGWFDPKVNGSVALAEAKADQLKLAEKLGAFADALERSAD